MQEQPIGVVFNPNSKKNRARPARFEALQRLVGDRGEVRRTGHVDELDAVAHAFLDAGVVYWVADGGDGAFHWLLNAAARATRARGRGEALPAILPTRSGTVDFLAVKAGLRGGPEDLLAALVATVRRGERVPTLEIDTLRLRGAWQPGAGAAPPAALAQTAGASLGPASGAFDRLGFAAALAGVGQGFFARFYDHGDLSARGILSVVGRMLGSGALASPPLARLPGLEAARAYAAPVFRPLPLQVWLDDALLPGPTYRAVNIGSIDINLAGVFRLFALAQGDGQLHALVGDPSAAQVAAALPALARGRPVRGPGLTERAVQRLRVQAGPGERLDPVIDGELFFGLESIEVEVGPRARVLQPAQALAAR
jgi:diacylglycerol kinase family enzyme